MASEVNPAESSEVVDPTEVNSEVRRIAICKVRIWRFLAGTLQIMQETQDFSKAKFKDELLMAMPLVRDVIDAQVQQLEKEELGIQWAR
jgi:hypothetical protein